MESDIITKRLHISGLKPAIIDDLSRRLASYGSVKALDGFGKLDGLGQPRKYGYVTLEGKRSQIQKCAYLVLLSMKLRLKMSSYRHECPKRCRLERR
jgi:hypothetical protein